MNILWNRHRLWLGGNGMRFSSRDKGVIPPRLVHYFLDQLQGPPSWDPPGGGEEGEDLLEDLRFHNISKGDNDLQLVVKLDLVLPEGSTLPGVEILIDTGAEVNLIREGLVPKHLLSPAEKTFRFLTADGTRMRGGDKVVQLKMSFQKTTMTDTDPTKFETEGLFYQADIQADAILSHPWLVEKRLGVIPHLKALTVLEPELALLRGSILDPLPNGTRSGIHFLGGSCAGRTKCRPA